MFKSSSSLILSTDNTATGISSGINYPSSNNVSIYAYNFSGGSY